MYLNLRVAYQHYEVVGKWQRQYDICIDLIDKHLLRENLKRSFRLSLSQFSLKHISAPHPNGFGNLPHPL